MPHTLSPVSVWFSNTVSICLQLRTSQRGIQVRHTIIKSHTVVIILPFMRHFGSRGDMLGPACQAPQSLVTMAPPPPQVIVLLPLKLKKTHLAEGAGVLGLCNDSQETPRRLRLRQVDTPRRSPQSHQSAPDVQMYASALRHELLDRLLDFCRDHLPTPPTLQGSCATHQG